ncbi:MAG: hypothetical protein ABMA64_23665 [Myxococcota bacterium]
MWWAVAASAAVPVVYDGADGVSVVIAVADRAGLPATQLAPTKLDELLATEPAVLGDAAMRRCSRAPATSLEIQAEVVRAETAWAADRDGPAAMDHLDLVVGSIGCAAELVDRRVAASAFALRGGLAAELGEIEIARGELRTALAFTPDLVWAPRWPSAGSALLEELRATSPAAHLSLSPDDPSSGPWLDGVELRDGAAVVPGLHLFQHSSGVGIRSAWVTIGGDSTFVVPSQYRRPVLERLADPARAAEIEHLLQASIPEFEVAYVASGGGVWLIAVDGGVVGTTEITPPPPPPEPTGKKPKKPKNK